MASIEDGDLFRRAKVTTAINVGQNIAQALGEKTHPHDRFDAIGSVFDADPYLGAVVSALLTLPQYDVNTQVEALRWLRGTCTPLARIRCEDILSEPTPEDDINTQTHHFNVLTELGHTDPNLAKKIATEKLDHPMNAGAFKDLCVELSQAEEITQVPSSPVKQLLGLYEAAKNVALNTDTDGASIGYLSSAAPVLASYFKGA